MRLALYQPDIPQNAGAQFRLAACFGLPVDVIEPCGFVFDDRRLRRAGMDYIDHVRLERHASWQVYLAGRQPGRCGRLIVLTTAGDTLFPALKFEADDTILTGRESSGVPAEVHEAADIRLRIPLRPGLRSLNVAQAAAMVLSEALRQTGGFPAT